MDRSTSVSVGPETAVEKNKNESDEGDIACGGWLLRGGGTGAESPVNDTYLGGWSSSLLPHDVELAKVMSEEDEAKSGWDVDFSTNDTPWSELTGGEKAMTCVKNILRIICVLASLYFFICSLSFLASGFRLVAGKDAGSLFRNSEVFNNPVAGMLMGVLVTVLVQSSSTSTSIVITMVAAELLTVKQAIYLIMGANIGTSVTSTIVAMGQVANRDEFRRAFAAATVHDMFNFLSVIVLLPLEAITGYLYALSGALISDSLESSEKPPDILKVLTKPFTKAIMSIDKKLITKIAAATPEELKEYEDSHILKDLFGAGPDDLSDGAAGTIVLIFALVILCTTLFLIVLMLKALLKGRVAVWLHKSVNGNIPDLKCGGVTIPLGWVTGYLAILAGFGITICVQSSSITTSALTPLVGVGVIQVERMYPVVLGANIGTCITGVLAALASDGSKLALTLRVAYAHLFFNFSGILLWYIIWPLRRLPIGAAKFLGNTTAKYRWFALMYLFVCFFVVPAIWVGLSLAGTAPLIIVTVLVILIGLSIALLNVLQTYKSHWLPNSLKTWDFLPVWMRSLEPIDRLICAPLTAKCCCGPKTSVVPN